MNAPDRGDLIIMNFDPQTGHEQAKRRPGLVVSPVAFNQTFGVAFVAPITTKPRGHAFEVALPPESAVHGVILVHQTKSLDWRARHAQLAGQAPTSISDAVNQLLKAILDG